MKNIVELIGLCININETYMELLMSDKSVVKVYFQEKEAIENIQVNVLTRVLGKVGFIEEFPFNVVIVEKVYQIKDIVN